MKHVISHLSLTPMLRCALARRVGRSMPRATTARILALCVFCFALIGERAQGEETKLLVNALNTLSEADLRHHVGVLADDTFEGREAGARGGQAAAKYLVEQFAKIGLKPAGADGSFLQPFSIYTNILGMIEGTDPRLKQEFILLGGHFDHVGYGTPDNSYGPFGKIHNGADDNASGVASILEIAQAFQAGPKPARSILFCLWDAEEAGLLGSKYWLDHPTIDRKQLKFTVNLDMVGRLRKQQLELLGVRSATGLRQLLSLPNDDERLLLKFNWELKEDSDHYPFLEKGIPTVMLHTGLHQDYHRPSDDLERVNFAGTREVCAYCVKLLYQMADQPAIPGFRRQCFQETVESQNLSERTAPVKTGRLGVQFKGMENGQPGIVVTSVRAGSAADRAGLQAGDVIESFAGINKLAADDFAGIVLEAGPTAEATILRDGATAPITLAIPLAGSPTRVGIQWRWDPAEPGVALITGVDPGSRASKAGIRILDRIFNIAGQSLTASDSLRTILDNSSGETEVLLERSGRIQRVMLTLPDEEGVDSAP